MKMHNVLEKAKALIKAPWTAEGIIFSYALAFVFLYNGAFWSYLVKASQLTTAHALIFFPLAALLLLAFWILVFGIFPFRWVSRPLLTLLLPLSALTVSFMSEYGMALDDKMVQNVFETDVHEAFDLLTPTLVMHFLVLGLVPAVLLWRLPLRKAESWWSLLRRRLLWLSAALLVIVCVVASQYQTLAGIARNHKEIRFYLIPNNVAKGLIDQIAHQFDHDGNDHALQSIAQDAKPSPSAAARERKNLLILVVGETARAYNFGLAGYVRNTTPKLSENKEIIYFNNMRSCGTDTATSLPCMMSNLGRENYSRKKATAQENILDISQRAGFKVLWIDNQSGCKGVCNRVERVMTVNRQDPAFCSDGECHDEILVSELKKYADTMTQDTLVVLHQMGSHGPAYHKRYPAAFEKFKPVCETSQLDKCSRNQIVNAYDNTILYTDHILSAVLDEAKLQRRHVNTAVFYISDHGESLGEMGLYLHGAPYLLAPMTQKHVPALTWISPELQADQKLDMPCVAAKRADAYSHDNLFDTLLGLMQIQTASYRPQLDILQPCRR